MGKYFRIFLLLNNLLGIAALAQAQDLIEAGHAREDVRWMGGQWVLRHGPSMEGKRFKNGRFDYTWIQKAYEETEGKKTVRWWLRDRKSTRLNSSHLKLSRMPSSA